MIVYSMCVLSLFCEQAKFQFCLEAIVSIQSKSDYLTISSEYRKIVHIVQALRVSENSFNPDFRICTQTNVEPYAHKWMVASMFEQTRLWFQTDECAYVYAFERTAYIN